MRPPVKYTLLIVDDEPDVCDSVHDLLRREFRVLKAHSGAEGYRIMQEEEVHIIMTDQRMPQVSGVELLTKIKARNPQAVRMLFTGYRGPGVDHRGDQPGARVPVPQETLATRGTPRRGPPGCA